MLGLPWRPRKVDSPRLRNREGRGWDLCRNRGRPPLCKAAIVDLAMSQAPFRVAPDHVVSLRTGEVVQSAPKIGAGSGGLPLTEIMGGSNRCRDEPLPMSPSKVAKSGHAGSVKLQRGTSANGGIQCSVLNCTAMVRCSPASRAHVAIAESLHSY